MKPPTRGRISTLSTASSRPVNSSQSRSGLAMTPATVTSGAGGAAALAGGLRAPAGGQDEGQRGGEQSDSDDVHCGLRLNAGRAARDISCRRPHLWYFMLRGALTWNPNPAKLSYVTDR